MRKAVTKSIAKEKKRSPSNIYTYIYVHKSLVPEAQEEKCSTEVAGRWQPRALALKTNWLVRG